MSQVKMNNQKEGSNKESTWKDGVLFMRFLISIAIVLALGVVIYFGYKKHEELPRKIDEFSGVYIGASESDVLILKGKPGQESKIETDGSFFYKESKYVTDNMYSHMPPPSVTIFEYEGRDENSLRVRKICHYGLSRGGINSVNDIEILTPLNYLLEKLGSPSSQDISSDKLSVMYSYSRYNLLFIVEKGLVRSFCVTDGSNYVFRG